MPKAADELVLDGRVVAVVAVAGVDQVEAHLRDAACAPQDVFAGFAVAVAIVVVRLSALVDHAVAEKVQKV